MEHVGRIPLVKRKRKKPWGPDTRRYFLWAMWYIVLTVFNGYFGLAFLVGDHQGDPLLFFNLVAAGAAFYAFIYFWRKFIKCLERDRKDDD